MNSKTPLPPQYYHDDDITRVPVEKHAPAAQPPHEYGSFTSHLRIEGVVGEGGVGRVYLAYDKRIGRRVAVKEMLSPSTAGNKELTNSFIHEAKITAKLEHPGIIPIYEIGNRSHHGPYYVMKYIKGITMEERFRNFEGNSSENDFKQRIKLLDTLIDVCETLAYAHEKGVIHRDIKPNNIISGKFGETIIIDWGLAQVISSDDNTQFFNNAIIHQQHTLSDASLSTNVGTPRYMAPEQVLGHASKASDVYSLGIILFRIITGEFPSQSSGGETQKQSNNKKNLPSPIQLNPSAPVELVAICEKAIARSENQRFTDASELLTQLNDYRDGRMVKIYNYTKKELLSRFFLRNKLLVSMLCVLFITILTGAGFALHYAYLMNIAKADAEHAVVAITTYSERAQKEAHAISEAIKSSSDELYADLKLAANKLSQLSTSDSAQENMILSDLQNQYPGAESFSIKQSDALSESLSGWKTIKQKYDDAPIVKEKNGRLQFIFRTPIYEGNHFNRHLEAIMYPEVVIPVLFSKRQLLGPDSQDVWIMRHDGLIIYDKNRRYLGTNLFTDPANRFSSSLLAFGQLAFSTDDGIGHYDFIEGNHKIEKIASWGTVQFNKTVSWIIIVTYSYLVKDISHKPELGTP